MTTASSPSQAVQNISNPPTKTINPNPTQHASPSSQPSAEENIYHPVISAKDDPSIGYFSSSSSLKRGFPFMVVTLFLFVIVAGFLGSFVFFYFTGGYSKKTDLPSLITPPLTITIMPSPTSKQTSYVIPFTSPSATASPTPVYSNPFNQPTPAYENPFATTSGYINPFE